METQTNVHHMIESLLYKKQVEQDKQEQRQKTKQKKNGKKEESSNRRYASILKRILTNTVTQQDYPRFGDLISKGLIVLFNIDEIEVRVGVTPKGQQLLERTKI